MSDNGHYIDQKIAKRDAVIPHIKQIKEKQRWVYYMEGILLTYRCMCIREA